MKNYENANEHWLGSVVVILGEADDDPVDVTGYYDYQFDEENNELVFGRLYTGKELMELALNGKLVVLVSGGYEDNKEYSKIVGVRHDTLHDSVQLYGHRFEGSSIATATLLGEVDYETGEVLVG